MTSEALEHIFKSSYQPEGWKKVLRGLFAGADVIYTSPRADDGEAAKHQIAESILEIGSQTLADKKILRFYEVELVQGKHVSKNRVELRNLLHDKISPGDTDAILVCFHTPGDTDWRLTFISKSIYWDEDFTRKKEETHPKRYTYVLGEDESVRTALNQFGSLFDTKITIKAIIEAFSVEKLNKEFFGSYKKHYERFWQYVADEPNGYRKHFSAANADKQDKAIRDFAKKLLGRIVFLYFLQKKGWMGCSTRTQHWEDGEKQFMQKLFDGFTNPDRFHSDCLTQLFFNTLNEKRANDLFSVEGLADELNHTRVPYLNGGLFETDKPKGIQSINFPQGYFKDLFEFLGQYNFTIDENRPDDHEVGIDPEMLGHIFENLLEDNKDKGAFYTPKEIVQYMTQESLIQYLQTHLGEHAEIEAFIRYHEKGDENDKNNFIRNNGSEIERLLDEVKICDPAIGSGAFPMGMLQEIFQAKMSLDWTLNRAHRAQVKRDIIQNSIYGVDLDNGAVDIARLRFWLALVVDEDVPEPLPNLDYKIMQGNSLLESFEGIDLSEIHEGKSYDVEIENAQVNMFSGDAKKKVSQSLNFERIEDLIKDYFNADSPELKKDLHNRIDKHVLNHIRFTLNDHRDELTKQAKKQKKALDVKVANLRTGEQKIKYQSESKEAKKLALTRNELNHIEDKEIKLAQLYHSTDRPFFLWHLFFKEVFDAGGFDIVIGNPPWGAKVSQEQTILIKERNKEIIARMTDSFMFFVNESLKKSKKKGVVCKIIPEVILNQQDNRLLRKKLIDKTTITDVVNLGDDIFNDVTRASCIVLFRNQESEVFSYRVGDFEKVKGQVKFLYHGATIDSSLVKSLPNYIFPSQDLQLYKLIQFLAPATNLSNVLDEDSIQRGVSPDYKDAFIVPEEIITTQLLEKEFLRKTVTGGKEIRKFLIEDKGRYVIYTDRNTDPESIPNIISFISQYRDKITCKEVAQNKHPFYSLHRPRNRKIFEKASKILGVITGDKIIVALDLQEIHPTDGAYLMSTGSLESDIALTAILNSKMGTMLYRLFSNEKGKILAQIKPKLLEQIPIPLHFNSFAAPLIRTTRIVMWLNNTNTEFDGLSRHISQFFEEVIDGCVFELYFEEHMKERGIAVITDVQNSLDQFFGKVSFEQLDETEKAGRILALYKHFLKPDNPVRNKLKLFAAKSPEILKPILESTQ